ncbi:MAG: DUF5060 domain-containing protein, partial [Chloroflexota bacterium]|nr:DUF5060 domain-containing protein [Chloroflexota bacterium]
MDRLARLIFLTFLLYMLTACGNATATTVPALAVNTVPAPQTAETPAAAQPPPAGHTPAVHTVGTTAPVHGNLTALDLTATAAAQPIQPNITPPAGAVTPGATSVPRYGIFEQRFSWSSAAYTNPWEQVQLTMMLNAPSGKSAKIGGFYYAPNEWRARFSPNEIGVWAWQATITDGNKKEESKGSFTVVASNAPGFARVNPNNKFRWVLDDGSPYYPIGIGDCILSKDPAVSPLNNMGFDGGPVTESNREGQRTDLDTYLKAYSAAGINLFRWSVDNCAFGLYKTIDPQGNVYGLQEGL